MNHTFTAEEKIYKGHFDMHRTQDGLSWDIKVFNSDKECVAEGNFTLAEIGAWLIKKRAEYNSKKSDPNECPSCHHGNCRVHV